MAYKAAPDTSGFSNFLVSKQIKMRTVGLTREQLDAHVVLVRRLWEAQDSDKDKRNKFVMVDWIGETPFHVLVSEYSEFYWPKSSASMDMFLLRYHGVTLGAVPVPTYLIRELGGISRVSRLILTAGLEAVLDQFKNSYNNEAIEPVVREIRAMLEIEKEGL